ncbi:substrate-binding domain-containing protein [Paenarthrobacter nicotinovorans]|uniref:Substrate-binding domain-containing protein n=1 Tax=Paenarthrobacter nicotinovorans TaxID=29320 RepID=A0ABV0GNL4_PAENI|nr:substrate-binding domain-containing protein [Paenarthrobacter nicotinovorans]
MTDFGKHAAAASDTCPGQSLPAPSIREVAAAAGVSTATVSRALRRLPRVATATRERIEVIAANLGYVPSSAASELARGRSSRRSTRTVQSKQVELATLLMEEPIGTDNSASIVPAPNRFQPGRATIYDIAKVVGVNPSTVSRALSEPSRVSAKTREQVQEAAQELDFHVNPYARALLTGQTRTLGLIVADMTNPTFFDVIRGAEATAARHGYALVLAESAERAPAELTAARRIISRVDGLILASPRMHDVDIQALAQDRAVVVINREVNDVPRVVPDVNIGIGEAIRSLVANGHQKVAFVAGPAESWMSIQRWEGMQLACERSGLEAVRLSSSKPTVDGGRRVAPDIRACGATAVLAYNDLLAIGLMHELQAAGILIPDEISVVGFDDIFGAGFTTPPLTTIRSPLGECGSWAVTLLLSMLAGTGTPPSFLHIDTRLVLRGSSGRLVLAP